MKLPIPALLTFAMLIAAPPALTAPAADCTLAETHWKAAEDIKTIEAYEDHLERFPDCPFATLARARIEALKHKAQERWAAVASDGASRSPVVWADSKEEAMRRALAACNRISNTCGDTPAITPNMDDIFTVMCCERPRHACAIYPDSTRESSLAGVRKIFDAHGFSSCRVLRRMSAQTGATID